MNFKSNCVVFNQNIWFLCEVCSFSVGKYEVLTNQLFLLKCAVLSKFIICTKLTVIMKMSTSYEMHSC